MADHNVEGHLQVLTNIWSSAAWSEMWEAMGCEIESFARLGIPHDTRDADLWKLCQEHGIVLVTGNRNAEGTDSLENAAETRKLVLLTGATGYVGGRLLTMLQQQASGSAVFPGGRKRCAAGCARSPRWSQAT